MLPLLLSNLAFAQDWIPFPTTTLTRGFDCGDGNVVDLGLHHVHVQDYSSSFKQEGPVLGDVLGEVIEELHSQFTDYKFSLINSLDKDIHKDNVGNDFECAAWYIDNESDANVAASKVSNYLSSTNLYLTNDQRPDLIDGIYEAAKRAKTDEDFLTVITVWTDQCMMESCTDDLLQNPDFPEFWGSSCPLSEGTDSSMTCGMPQYAQWRLNDWCNDPEARNMGADDCHDRDFPTLGELSRGLSSSGSSVRFLYRNTDTEYCKNVNGEEGVGTSTIPDYYGQRVVPFLNEMGASAGHEAIAESYSDWSEIIINQIHDAVCFGRTSTTTTTSTTATTVTATLTTTVTTCPYDGCKGKDQKRPKFLSNQREKESEFSFRISASPKYVFQMFN